MARLVDDKLWGEVSNILLREKRHPPKAMWEKRGRKPIDDRRVLTGVVFVLKTGIPWAVLPQEMGCGSGITCWRRMKEWRDAGILGEILEVVSPCLKEGWNKRQGLKHFRTD